MKKYSIIYADPPWQYDQGGRGSTRGHYQTMSIDQLCALPVVDIVEDDAILCLWVTGPFLEACFRVAHAWGFTFKTILFTWTKFHDKSGKVAMGGGQWTRANAEFVLLFIRGTPPRRVSAGVRQVVEDDVDPFVEDTLYAHRGKHSAKPPAIRSRIDELMGPARARIELFARERVPGWDAWGNEIVSDVNLSPGDLTCRQCLGTGWVKQRDGFEASPNGFFVCACKQKIPHDLAVAIMAAADDDDDPFTDADEVEHSWLND